jgi:predicted Rossmann-fold nucleotide-binding protein
MNIFVGGSLRNIALYGDLCQRFVQHLGEHIVERGHTLLGGCRGSLDKAVAEAASGWLDSNNRDKRQQLISYRLKNDPPAHRLGRIQVSLREDWELGHKDLCPPEQIAEADATVFIAGSAGTLSAANWARIADKPILGVAQFGGAGRDIFELERSRFKERYSHLVAAKDFDILNQDTEDVDQLASDVVTLCERIITSNSVFAIMPFTEEFHNVYVSYSTVCEEFGFRAERTDQTDSGERIIPRIIAGIRRAAFVLADVTHPSANVFYEIGFAEGMGRPVIVSAKRNTLLPFDIADIPVLFWDGPEELKDKLRRRVKEIAPVIRRKT